MAGPSNLTGQIWKELSKIFSDYCTEWKLIDKMVEECRHWCFLTYAVKAISQYENFSLD